MLKKTEKNSIPTLTMMEQYTGQYSPDELRDRIVAPLKLILRDLEEDLELFEKTVKAGGIPRGYLPLSGKSAESSIARLRKFQAGQLRNKLLAYLLGGDIYRDKTKKKL